METTIGLLDSDSFEKVAGEILNIPVTGDLVQKFFESVGKTGNKIIVRIITAIISKEVTLESAINDFRTVPLFVEDLTQMDISNFTSLLRHDFPHVLAGDSILKRTFQDVQVTKDNIGKFENLLVAAVAYGINLEHVNTDGHNLLSAAVTQNKISLVKLLLKYGATPTNVLLGVSDRVAVILMTNGANVPDEGFESAITRAQNKLVIGGVDKIKADKKDANLRIAMLKSCDDTLDSYINLVLTDAGQNPRFTEAIRKKSALTAVTEKGKLVSWPYYSVPALMKKVSCVL
jgi:hypothetical protein